MQEDDEGLLVGFGVIFVRHPSILLTFKILVICEGFLVIATFVVVVFDPLVFVFEVLILASHRDPVRTISRPCSPIVSNVMCRVPLCNEIRKHVKCMYKC